MAGVRFSLTSSITSTGAARKTILQAKAAANHRAHIDEWGISFEGILATDEPIYVELVEQSDVGTGGDAVTPRKINPSDSETLQVTAVDDVDGSPAPTDTAVKWAGYVHPQGAREWQAPSGKAWPIPGGGFLGIVVTADDAVNLSAYMFGEE